MRFKQFGMMVGMLLLTLTIGVFGCSSSSDDDGAATGKELKAVAPADFSAGTGELSINTDGAIESSGDSYSFILTGDVELPEDATADDVTYEWTTVTEGVEGVVIANPNQKSTSVEIPSSVTGAVEFKLTVTYNEKSSEAVTTVTLTGDSSNILYVASDGTGDGSSWANALSGSGDDRNLQTAIDAAKDTVADEAGFDSIEIWVKAGTYLPTWNWNEDDDDARYSSFKLQNGVSVIGGFAGDESSKSDREKSDVAGRIYANETILSGDLDGNDNSVLNVTCETVTAGAPTDEGEGLRTPLTTTVIDCSAEGAYIKEIENPDSYSDNAFHVVYHNDEAVTLDETAKLDGVVIKGGNALSDDNDDADGGGIYNLAASPTIISTIVENNRADSGGGIFITGEGASPTIISSIIQYNYADSYGAGIDIYENASSKIQSSIIQYNYSNGYGGGIDINESSQSEIIASLIKSNYAESQGGGVSDGGYSTSNVIASVIKNNFSLLGGGGFFSEDSGEGSTITSSIIQSNFTVDNDGGTGMGGGILIGSSASFGLINSVVIENIAGSADSGGGGITGDVDLTRLQIYNSVVSDNIARRADLAERIEIDSYYNDGDETAVFYSIVKSVAAGNSSLSDAKVTFYNMLNGTGALNLAAIDFGSYTGDNGETYTLPNLITTVVKSIAPKSAYRNTGVPVAMNNVSEPDEEDPTFVDYNSDFYYQGGEGKWYDFKNEPVDLPAGATTITVRDIYGNSDAGQPDIGPVIQ